MANTLYIGAKCVPSFYIGSGGSSEWTAGVPFEPLTVVTYNGTWFISKKQVPANAAAPQSGEYWAQIPGYITELDADLIAWIQEHIGDLEDNVEELQGDVTELKDDLTNTIDIIHDGVLEVSSFIQGNRYPPAIDKVYDENNRCTMPFIVHMFAGDEINFTVPDGLNASVAVSAGSGTIWLTGSVKYTVAVDAYTVVGVRKPDNSAITPSDIEGLTINFVDKSSIQHQTSSIIGTIQEKDDFTIDLLSKYYTYHKETINFTGYKLLNLDGTIGDFPNSGEWMISDEIDISDYAFVKVDSSSGWNHLLYALYDADHTFIRGLASAASDLSSYSGLIDLTGAEKYIRIACINSVLRGALYTIDGLAIYKWAGKKWCCIGDSLTEVNATATKRYYEYIADKTGIECINKGVGGTGYANPNGTAGNFVTRMASVPTDSDVYTIFGSFNDYQYSVDNSLPIGSPDDSGTTSICGYINSAFDALFTRVPLANLGVIAPCPWGGINAISGTTATKQFGEDYSEALRLCCERRSIPFLDLYHYSGMRPWNAGFAAVVYTNSDNATHPNEVGQAILSTKIGAFVETLLN